MAAPVSVPTLAPRLVVESVPGLQRGMSYDVSGGATLGRGDVARLGELFLESHASLRDDFEVSTPEHHWRLMIRIGSSPSWGISS